MSSVEHRVLPLGIFLRINMEYCSYDNLKVCSGSVHRMGRVVLLKILPGQTVVLVFKS